MVRVSAFGSVWVRCRLFAKRNTKADLRDKMRSDLNTGQHILFRTSAYFPDGFFSDVCIFSRHRLEYLEYIVVIAQQLVCLAGVCVLRAVAVLGLQQEP